MIFLGVEYDAGASLHHRNAQTFQHIKAHSRRGEVPTLSFSPHFKYQFVLNVIKRCNVGRSKSIPLCRQEMMSLLMVDRMMKI
jgi:hypothetical protein